VHVLSLLRSLTSPLSFSLNFFPSLVFRYNGLKCNPVERHEGRNKRLEVCSNAERSNDGTRTKAIDFEVVMQTVMETSKSEKMFFNVLAGDGTHSRSKSERGYFNIALGSRCSMLWCYPCPCELP